VVIVVTGTTTAEKLVEVVVTFDRLVEPPAASLAVPPGRSKTSPSAVKSRPVFFEAESIFG
jgi:hypothetical protein